MLKQIDFLIEFQCILRVLCVFCGPNIHYIDIGYGTRGIDSGCMCVYTLTNQMKTNLLTNIPPPLPHTYLTMHDLTHSTLYHILCDIHYGCRLCLFTGTKTAPFTHYRIRDGTSESTHFPTASCYFRQQLSSFFTLAHKRIA